GHHTSKCSPQLALATVIWEKPDGGCQKKENVQTDFKSVNAQMSPEPASSGAGITVAEAEPRVHAIINSVRSPTSIGDASVEGHFATVAEKSGPGVKNRAPASEDAGSSAAAVTVPTGPVRSISFNRASYDPTKYNLASPMLVAVAVTLNLPIDQEARIYANG